MAALNEAEEGFGAPPARSADDLAARLIAVSSSDDRLQEVQECLRMAEDAEGDAYTAALKAYLAIPAAMGDFEDQKAFFHAAAAFGETRLLVRVLGSVLAKAAEEFETVGSA